MKNNLRLLITFWSFLFIHSFTCILSAQNGCIPSSSQPIFGTVSGATGTFTFDNIPTGSMIEIQSPAAGIQYAIDMCASNADGWI